MVTKTPEELDEMLQQINEGKLPKDAVKKYLAAEQATVFGVDHKVVKGVPQEQGIGAPGHETINHFNSLRKYEGEDAYQAAVADLWKRDPKHAKKLGLPPPKQKAA